MQAETGALYEPEIRNGHVAVEFNGKIYVWGGTKTSYNRFKDQNPTSSYSQVDIFDPQVGKWSFRPATGDAPFATDIIAYATIGSKAYVLGGARDNTIHELDLTSMEWRALKAENPFDGPARKYGCRMVAFGEYNILMIFGGGIRECTNELHVFNLEKGSWSLPPVCGNLPEPRSWSAFAKINECRAIVFGGTGIGVTTDAVYNLNIEEWPWHWTKVATSGPAPLNTCYFGAQYCYIGGPPYGPQHPMLMVFGTSTRSMYNLDLESMKWYHVSLSQPAYSAVCCSQSATVVPVSFRSLEVVLFGTAQPNTAILLDYPGFTLYELCVKHIVDHYDNYLPVLHHIPKAQEHVIRWIKHGRYNQRKFPVVLLDVNQVLHDIHH